MDIITLGLGLVFLAVGLISLKRGRIYAGGRKTRGKITGIAVRYIAIPQAIVGGLTAAVGAADLAGYSPIGQYSSVMIWVLIVTYLVTNLGIGGFFDIKSTIDEARQSKEE